MGSGASHPIPCSISPSPVCSYYFFPNAVDGSVQDKQNKLLNALYGLTSIDDFLTALNRGDMNSIKLAIVLVMPPAIDKIYAIVPGYVPSGGGGGQITAEYLNVFNNPFLIAAQLLEQTMAGAGSNFFQYSVLPCSPTVNVPYTLWSQTNTNGINWGDLVYKDVPVHSASGGGYQACLKYFRKQLDRPILVDGIPRCVGDTGYPNIQTSGPYYTFVGQSGITDILGGNYTGLMKFLNTPLEAGAIDIFFKPYSQGPMDVTTGGACKSLDDVNCSYKKCQSDAILGYNCVSGGVCQPIYKGSPVPPRFPTLEACQGCQQTGNCGLNTCCKNPVNGACPKIAPSPSPGGKSIEIESIMSLIVLALLVAAGFYITRTMNRM